VSPLILLVLVVMWAVVLVPMWLRRHDEAEETRSVDKFTSAMHTLSRREKLVPDKKYVLMPHRSRSYDVHVSGASVADEPAPAPAQPARPPVTAATRRRRTLIGLLVATVLTLVLAIVVGGLPLIALQLVTDACLVAFVLHLRNRARRAALARPARRRPAATAATVVMPRVEPEPRYEAELDAEFEPVAVRVAASAGGAIFDQALPTRAAPEDSSIVIDTVETDSGFDQDVSEPDRAPAASYDVATEPAPAEATIDAGADAGTPEDGDVGTRPWEPVPVPRPVYASKPAAPAPRRRAPTFEPLLPPVDSPAEVDEVDDLEEILDRRWAVND
jgi:hypothetical protein